MGHSMSHGSTQHVKTNKYMEKQPSCLIGKSGASRSANPSLKPTLARKISTNNRDDEQCKIGRYIFCLHLVLSQFILHVVYFDQRTSAPHAVCWSKSIF